MPAAGRKKKYLLAFFLLFSIAPPARCELWIDRLLSDLKNPDSSIRYGAVRSLGEVDFIQAAESLMALLADKNEQTYIRARAAASLGKLRYPGVAEALIAALEEKGVENHEIRKAAAEALGKQGDIRAVIPLAEASLNGSSSQVRISAMMALEKLRDPRSVDYLAQSLGDPDSSVRTQAASALGGIGIRAPRAVASLLALLRDDHEKFSVRYAAAEALCGIGELEAVVPILKMSESIPGPDIIHTSCADLLRGKAILEWLKAELEAMESERRRAAAWALGKLEVSETVALLAGAIRDADARVRLTAAQALEHKSEAAIPALAGVLDGEDLILRTAAIQGLRAIEGEQAVIERLARMGKASTCATGECHRERAGSGFIHLPVLTGACPDCHRGDASRHPAAEGKEFVPTTEGPALCKRCHQIQGENAGYSNHPLPGQGDCLTCHDPHNAGFKFLIRQKPETLCLGCHPRTSEILSAAKVLHPAMEKVPCTGCHDPHGSGQPGFLKESTRKLCFGCHKEIGAKVENSRYSHRPVGDGRCCACHEPHGSDQPKLLKKFFPPEFYLEFKVDNYDLCWQCHDRNITLVEKGADRTGFRNGELNLHFLHVNGKKGRSCKACHDIHAADQKKIISSRWKWGWSMPINYRQTQDGGRCVVGCHRELSYDREHPITYR